MPDNRGDMRRDDMGRDEDELDNVGAADGSVSVSDSTVSDSGLHPSQELLLGRFFDGDLGWWSRRKADRLLQNNASAQQYFQSLEEGQRAVDEVVSTRERNAQLSSQEFSELWKRIEGQLDQEAYAQMLARRQPANSKTLLASSAAQSGRLPGMGAAPGWLARLQWGLSGAVVSAASVLLVVAPAVQRSPIQVASSLSPGRAVTAQPETIRLEAVQPELLSGSPEGLSRAVRSDVPLQADVSLQTNGGGASFLRAQEVSFNDNRGASPEAPGAAIDANNSGASLSDAIAAALAERARRDAAARRGYMTVNRSSPSRSVPSALQSGSSDEGFGSRVPRAIEVDWMRSKGRVRVFHDPVEKAAYIWVKPVRSAFPGASLNDGSYQISSSSIPSATLVEAVH